MRKALEPVLAVLFVVAACSCAGEPAPEPGRDDPLEAATERAEQAARALGRDLMQRLLAELRAGGPVEAVRVCSEVAQDVAAAHSVEGVTVRRVSLKVRNPADTPDGFERGALAELERLHRQGRLPPRMTEVVAADRGRSLRYLRPIVIMPACLTCHGPAASIDPEVARILEEHYPGDQAIGYSDGDLRGAISVTVPLD